MTLPQVEEHADDVLLLEGAELREALVEDEEGWVRTQILTTESAFSRVGLMYDAPRTLAVQVRHSVDGGATFSSWHDAQGIFDEGLAHNAAADLPEDVTHVQVRIEGGAQALEHLMVALVEPEPQAAELAAPAGPNAAPSFVVSRAQWGARPTRCTSGHAPNRITVHHTVTANADSMSVPARMRQIQSFHMDVNGWCDLGYHYLVGRDGKVYEGRAESLVGTHVGGGNTGNAGVSFIGTFTDVAPTEAMFQAGARILADLSARRGITLDRQRVKGHRQFNSTECPGAAFYPRLGELVERARDVAGGGSGGSGGGQPPSDGSIYLDLPKSHWAYEAAIALREAGALYGCTTNRFCPDKALTRAEVAWIFARLLDLPTPAGGSTFSDVPSSHWAYDAIRAMAAAGLTAGCGGGRFCPDDPLSRAEAATFLANEKGLLGGPPPASPTFVDVSTGDWFYEAVEAGYDAGYISGCATSPLRYCPQTSLTRAQAAALFDAAY